MTTTITNDSFEWILEYLSLGNVDYEDIFQYACVDGKIEIIKWIAQNHIADIRPKKFERWFMLAFSHGYISDESDESEEDVNTDDYIHKFTSESGNEYIFKNSNLEILKLLLEIYPNMDIDYVINDFECKKIVAQFLLKLLPDINIDIQKYSTCKCEFCIELAAKEKRKQKKQKKIPKQETI
jgi:hypothetical protein